VNVSRRGRHEITVRRPRRRRKGTRSLARLSFDAGIRLGHRPQAPTGTGGGSYAQGCGNCRPTRVHRVILAECSVA
jgi:hypothetical protein